MLGVTPPEPRPVSTCPVPWIDESRGYLVDWLTQLWVRATRKSIVLSEQPWLAGPFGDTRGIGADFFARYGAAQNLEVSVDEPGAGLVDDMGSLVDTSLLSPAICHFYEHTSHYRLRLSARWCGLIAPFGWMIAYTFSRRLQQLNLPLTRAAASDGITSQVIYLRDRITGERRLTGWLRTFDVTGDALYVGIYGHTVLPGGEKALKVVFPLPNGNATVIMRPEARVDGSLFLESKGKGFGDAGFYFLVRDGTDAAHVRYLHAMKESIHVFEQESSLQASHVLRLFGIVFLRMHYYLDATS